MNSKHLKRFIIGGVLAAIVTVIIAFALHPFNFNGDGSANPSTPTDRREAHVTTFEDVRRLENSAPPPSHPTPTKGTQFYVAPNGRPDGDGSRNRPWDLATALAQPFKLKPGDTLWLRGGTYKGDFKSKLTGQEGRAILLAQFANERATIDGSLTVEGAWTNYWGFEVLNSNADRTRERPSGVEVFGPQTKFINLIVHDCGNGIAFWTPAIDAELYGNIIYNNGFQASMDDRGHGHGVYTQNDVGTKLIRENVIFNQFGWGIHAYTEEGSLKGFRLEGNILFNNGAATLQDTRYDNILVGGERPAERIALASNYTYQTLTSKSDKPNVRLYYADTGNQDLSITDNHFVGGTPVLALRHWQTVQMTGNYLYGLERLLVLGIPQGVNAAAYNWDRNTYVQGKDWAAFTFQDEPLKFAEWQKATGFDQSSNFVRNNEGRPTGVEVFIRPNQYETGRAHLIVYNWDLKETVEVNVASVLPIGAKYEIRDAQNYFGPPVLRGTYDGKTLRLPMKDLKVAPLIGGQVRLDSTAPEFAVFILLRTP